MNFLTAFARNDLKNIRRDSLLIYMLVIPWVMVLLVRLVVPWAARSYPLPLEPYYPLLISFFFILQFPVLFGLLFGLLFLDEKDDQVLVALRVTPVSAERYVQYRFLITILLSLAYMLIAIPATGLSGVSIIIPLIPVALLGSFFATLVLLVIIVFANNKVEGLAIMKAFGILMVGPMVAFFTDSPWQYLLGLLPSFWPAKAFWLISSGQSAWLYILAGFLYNALLFRLLYRRFTKKLRII